MHNDELNQPIIKTRTKVGGLFSLLSIIGALFIIIISFLAFHYNNVTESKSLVPLLNLVNEASKIEALIIINIVLYNYGGDCDINNKDDLIIYIPFDIKGDFYNFDCQSEGNDCECILICKKCSLNSGSYIFFNFAEANSYTGYFSVNVTSDSSIPGEISSFKTYIKPDTEGQVFIGSEESLVIISMTPSVIFT